MAKYVNLEILKGHPHLAILLAMLNMFNFPANLLPIFSYFEGEIEYNLAKPN